MNVTYYISRLFVMMKGLFIRMISIYYLHKVKHGKNVRIAGSCGIGGAEYIYIGDNSYINGHSTLIASPEAPITIGSNCLISYNVHIRTTMHNYLDAGTPINQQGETAKPINIGNDVWIGYGVMIKPGVKIGDGAVVGMGAVVTKDIPPYAVVVGVPARVIKYRFDNDVIKELLELRWWDFPESFVATLPFGDVGKSIELLRANLNLRVE